MRAPDKRRPVREIAADLARLWRLSVSVAVRDLENKLRFPVIGREADGTSYAHLDVWGMMQRRQPAMLKRYATGAQRQLLNMRCDYGWLVGDKLDETIKYLALLRSTKINPHGANFLRPFCAQLAWDWAPEHMRAKRHHEAAAALIFEYATGKPKQKLRRACSDVRKKMRTSRSKK